MLSESVVPGLLNHDMPLQKAISGVVGSSLGVIEQTILGTWGGTLKSLQQPPSRPQASLPFLWGKFGTRG